ncbi:MAG: pancreas/duodenum homeobox protein 1 [Thermodesulfobacteriota bacterium]
MDLPADPARIFTQEALDALFPPERTDRFFDALYGDAREGAYDIRLAFLGADPGQQQLVFAFRLHERPGACLACNLTYGLPQVFDRHPVIGVQSLVEGLVALLPAKPGRVNWSLGRTEAKSRRLHTIPLVVQLG